MGFPVVGGGWLAEKSPLRSLALNKERLFAMTAFDGAVNAAMTENIRHVVLVAVKPPEMSPRNLKLAEQAWPPKLLYKQ